jgi:glyoxylase-like metal-dependent hydrolase (beta-lactamase superfamily II)
MKSLIQANVEAFFDPETWTFTYVVYAGKQSQCVVIDSVMNYDPKSGRTSTKSADEVIGFIQSEQLQLTWVLETHAHADHLTAAPYIQSKLGGKIVIGDHITSVQNVFKGVFNLDDQFAIDGSQFDYLLQDGESLQFGDLTLKALYVPGHTPACMAYEIGDALFVGDTLFMPDVGTARCDFPGGSAHGIAAMLATLAIGSVLPFHLKAGFKSKKQWWSGFSQLGFLAVLLISGSLLYYGPEEIRDGVIDTHWIVGLLFFIVFILHAFSKIRSTRAPHQCE